MGGGVEVKTMTKVCGMSVGVGVEVETMAKVRGSSIRLRKSDETLLPGVGVEVTTMTEVRGYCYRSFDDISHLRRTHMQDVWRPFFE